MTNVLPSASCARTANPARLSAVVTTRRQASCSRPAGSPTTPDPLLRAKCPLPKVVCWGWGVSLTAMSAVRRRAFRQTATHIVMVHEKVQPATSDHSSPHPYALSNNTSSSLACTDLR